MTETAPAQAQAVATPRPLAPAQGERVDALSVTFSWSPVEGAEDYVLQVATESDFQAPLVSLHTGPVTSVTLYDALPKAQEQEIVWRVRAANQSAWGPAARFVAVDPEAVFSQEVEEAAEPTADPEWEARREELLAAMALEEQDQVSSRQVAIALGVIVVSFLVLFLVLLVAGQVVYQEEIYDGIRRIGGG